MRLKKPQDFFEDYLKCAVDDEIAVGSGRMIIIM
jgi:hypothetical protein